MKKPFPTNGLNVRSGGHFTPGCRLSRTVRSVLLKTTLKLSDSGTYVGSEISWFHIWVRRGYHVNLIVRRPNHNEITLIFNPSECEINLAFIGKEPPIGFNRRAAPVVNISPWPLHRGRPGRRVHALITFNVRSLYVILFSGTWLIWI